MRFALVHGLPLRWPQDIAVPSSQCPSLVPSLPMLSGILSRITNANDLKDALDLSAQKTRAISSRVAQASLNGNSGFALPVDPATGKPTDGSQVDLEAEMTSLADEQVRYDATEKLLEKTYAQMRTSIKN
jgi:flagellar basal body rod protein FlgB